MREFEDSVQDVSTTFGTGSFVMAGTPPDTMRPFSVHTVGATFEYKAFVGTQWEIGDGTWNGTSIARSPRESSNGGALVNFTTAPTVWEVVTSATMRRFLTAADGVDAATLTNITALAAGDTVLVVRADNSVVRAAYSLFGSGGTANTAPGAPTIGTATASVASATVAFTAPGSNGGSAITGYTATSSPGNITATGTASPINVPGLTNGTAYTFTVTATNAVGTGPASAASNSVTPVASATVPGAPTVGTAVAGDGYVDVAFTAPASNGGSAILDYTATLSNGQTATGTSSPIRVTTPNGVAVTATIKARNTVGSSAASAVSNSVTPAAASATMASTYLLRTDQNSAKFPTASVAMDPGSPDKSVNTTGVININIRSAANAVPTDFKFVWAKFGNPCPIAFTDGSVPIGATGNQQTHGNTVASPNKLGGWSDNTSQYYGTYNPVSNLYIWGTAGDYMLYIVYPDNSSKAVDNNTGTPQKWTLT